ncbi:ribonucleotide reductase subunit alpha [Advenella sp. FME57]|uniref:Ribonucleotide reductase subunit alpha n=1 Tax=Advenella kashmirensis TaxID=310575 RepID=A0A356LMB3_9BURK|nr:ribonucleotide reductase subunit alpha [Advenella sp. FME57]HBP32096.1 ribonucleotide reductase subunit alpha [Advenella kashmirensis]
MNISCFDELLAAARQQAEPQRLLFVFVSVELPDDCTPEQRTAFEAGSGGALTPLACLDKSPEELDTFEALCAESRQYMPHWTLVFAAALSGTKGRPLRSEDAEAPLNKMVEMIKSGITGTLIPFNTSGTAVTLNA